MGTHEYEPDPRNENVWISINKELFRRPDAKVSVLDAGFLLGDGLFETIRFQNEKIFRCNKHLDRLFFGLELIRIKIKKSKEEIKLLLEKIIQKNYNQNGL